ncbi:MAG: hypothetical protein R2822_17595 [Spirosomataceae bacterium]
MEKMFILAIFIGLLLLDITAYTQPENRLAAGIDIGGGWKDKAWVLSGQYSQYLKLDKKGFFQVGWGIRGTHLRGKELDFITAPANLSRTKTGLGALTAPLLLRQIDTLQIRSAITSFNFNLGVQLSFFNRLDIGANADLIGFAFGSRRAGYYLGSRGYNKIDSLNLHKTYQQARPTFWGTQLLGDNTVGNLHTEVYARLRFAEQIGLKVSYLFTASEYKTDVALIDDNRRFRFRFPMIYVALHFPLSL